MRFRKILSIVLALCLLTALLPMQTSAAMLASGTCGENLTWTLTDAGALTISGNGAMNDYPYSASLEYLAPWRAYASQITSATVENGVTYIGDHAFANLKKLTSVNIAGSVTAIGEYIFSGCESLKSATLPDSVVSMESGTFFHCYQLENVTLPQGLATLTSNTFRACRSLKKVIVPASVNNVEFCAFLECIGLEEVRFLGNAPTIGTQAFDDVSANILYRADDPTWTEAVMQDYGGNLFWVGVGNPAVDTLDNISGSCGASTTWTLKDGCLTISGTGVVEEAAWLTLNSKIKKVVIEEGVTNIAEYSFSSCTELTDVTIPNSVTEVGSCAFYNCSSLKKIVFPGNVTKIEGCAFDACSSLKEIVIPDTVSFIGQMSFRGCTSLKKITLPASLTSIEDYLFIDADSLESIIIPYGVKYIGYHAFATCNSLYSVEIPATVEYIEDRAFVNCTNLRKITFRGNAPKFKGNFPFEGVKAYAYYPAGNETWTPGAKTTYNAKLTWVAKSGIQQPLPEVPEVPATWSLENGVLTIWADTKDVPWSFRRNEIQQVVVQEGVTVLQDYALYDCDNLTSVTLPSSLTRIEYVAFAKSHNIKELVIPKNVTYISTQVFDGCSGLQKITFTGDFPDINCSFTDCSTVVECYYPAANETWEKVVPALNTWKNVKWLPYCPHNDNATVTVDADCLTAGSITTVCNVCGMKKDEPVIIPPQGHDYGLAEDGNPDFWDTTCDVCGAEREVDKHRPTHSMYRMYNPNTGEHFYTGSMEERKMLEDAGWKYEGVGFTFPVSTGKPVHRLFQPSTGEHLYTMDEAEKEKLLAEGWNYEGIAFNSAYDTEVPQYRLHNPNAKVGAYHFTASEEERDNLIAAGWEYQDIGWYSCWK